MAGGHVECSVLDIQKEQKEIEEIISSLLEFNPMKNSDSEVQNTPGIISNSQSTPVRPKSTPVTVAKPITRGRGRPKTKTTVTRNSLSRSSTTDSPTLSCASDILPTVKILIDCVEKLNNHNKQIVSRVKELELSLQNHYKEIDNNTKVHSCLSSSSSVVLDSAPPSELKTVVERVDKIEDNINSRLLICKGPVVAEKIKSFTHGNNTDTDKIKAHLSKSVCGLRIPKISVDSFEISIFGKERNSLKIECNNSTVKNYLLKQVRLNKPSGIYMSEYLSINKRKIYNRLVGLKREYPSVFKALYTREGEIFGKIGRATLRFKELKDVDKINLRSPEPSASCSPTGTLQLSAPCSQTRPLESSAARSPTRPLTLEGAQLPGTPRDECRTSDADDR